MGKRSPGLHASYLEDLPFYEFMEYRNILDEELKAELAEAEKQKAEQNKMTSNSSARLPKYKK